MATKRFQIGILGAQPGLQRACAAELSDSAHLVHISSATEHNTIATLDLLMLVMQPPHVEAVRRFGSLRELHPKLKVVLLVSGLDVNHAVEFVKLGAEDLLELPDATAALRLKVARALLGTVHLTITSPILSPLATGAALELGNDPRRACFRATIPRELGVAGVFRVEGRTTRLQMSDLSIPTESAPGGIGFSVSPQLERILPLESWSSLQATVPVELDVAGRLIRITAKVVRFDAPPPFGNDVGRLCVTYTLEVPADETVVQRLWVDAQRLAVAVLRDR